MGALTKDERDALEDVFLSIQTHRDRCKSLKEISSLIINRQRTFNTKILLKQAKQGLNETNLSRLLLNISKKKKNLSK